MAYTLLQTAITNERVGVVVHQIGTKARTLIGFGYRHTHRIGNTLPQWPRGNFDTCFRFILRMASTDRTEHTETLNLIQTHLLVTGQVEQRVDQH